LTLRRGIALSHGIALPRGIALPCGNDNDNATCHTRDLTHGISFCFAKKIRKLKKLKNI